MALGILVGLTRMYRRKRASSLDILTSKTGPRDFYKGKNCKPTGFHTRKGGYVVVPEKLPNYVVPDLTDFKISVKKDRAVWLQNMNLMSLSYNVGVVRTGLELKPYVSQCATEIKATDTASAS